MRKNARGDGSVSSPWCGHASSVAKLQPLQAAVVDFSVAFKAAARPAVGAESAVGGTGAEVRLVHHIADDPGEQVVLRYGNQIVVGLPQFHRIHSPRASLIFSTNCRAR